MEVKELYKEYFLKEFEKAGYPLEYNDNFGLHTNIELGINVKTWNNKIEFYREYEENIFKNKLLFAILIKCKDYINIDIEELKKDYEETKGENEYE